MDRDPNPMDTKNLLTRRDTRANKILPNPSNNQTFGYMAIRQWADGPQFIDYKTFANTPAECEILAHTDSGLWADENCPIVGYISVSIAIIGRIAK